MKKVSFPFNELISSGVFYDGFNEKELASLLEEKKEGEELAFYTQDNERFYRIYLIKKPAGIEFSSFRLAKTKGYLKALVDAKLEKMYKGKAISEDRKIALRKRLLKKEAGEVIAKKIIEAEKDGIAYSAHMEKRLKEFKGKEQEEIECPELLKQFSIYQGNEIVNRKDKSQEMAKEEFFAMEKGDVSSIYHLNNAMPYYIHFIAKKIDEEKLKKYEDLVHKEIAKEGRDRLFDQLVSYIEENAMIEMSRFEKGA